MRAFDWVKRLLEPGAPPGHLLQVLTPQAASGRATPTRVVLAGATLGVLVWFSAMALGALSVLMVALGAIYFLLTQVLGVRLDVDPEALFARAQQYAHQARDFN
jgi:hypothetical protein